MMGVELVEKPMRYITLMHRTLSQFKYILDRQDYLKLEFDFVCSYDDKDHVGNMLRSAIRIVRAKAGATVSSTDDKRT